MAKLPEDYVSVAERVAEFREKYPEGVIFTTKECIGDIIGFRATVYRDREEALALAPHGLAASSGHAEGVAGKEKVLEKIESTAVGRALALLGFSVKQGIASKEEMEEFEASKESTSRGFTRKSRDAKKEDEEEAPRRSRRSEPEEEVVKPKSRRADPEPEDEEEDDEEEEAPVSRRRR